MRSIPQAMTWEMFQNGRWHLVAGVLGANLLPAILFTALRRDGALDPTDPSQLVMHIVLVQINVFILGAAIFAAQGSPSRLYALPVPTSSLVAWQMIPAMALMGAISAASTAALNAVFNLGWPVWGPALFAATAVAAFQATFWLNEKSGWIALALAVVGGVVGIWFKSRYGAPFSQPVRLWTTVTPGEVATMLATAGLAYCGAVAGVSRNRRGDFLPALGIIAWLERMLDPAPVVGRAFRTPAEAQFWFEWRQKGWAMPAMVIFGIIVGSCMWLLFSRQPQDLFEGFLAGGALLIVGGLVGGVIMGNAGPNDANFAIGHFSGTRPMTNIDMARTILKVGVKSVCIAWLIWGAVFLVVYAILSAMHVAPQLKLPRQLGWWYFPATLLGAWTVLGLLTSVGLAGRTKLFVALFCGLFAIPIGLQLFLRFALSRQAQEQFGQGLLVVGGAIFILATAWAFIAAHRRALIGWPMIGVAASLWAAVSALIALIDAFQVSQRIPLYVLLVGVAALALAPLATAPMALAWNRTR